MVRLASVEFTKLKNVRAGTRLTFSKSGAVLLGKNGTGKTTLLQYLVAFCTADMSAFVSDEPFDVSATFLLEPGTSATLRLRGAPNPEPSALSEASPIAIPLPTNGNTRLEYRIISLKQEGDNDEYLIDISNNLVKLSHNNTLLHEAFPVLVDPKYQLLFGILRLEELITMSSSNDKHLYISISIKDITHNLYRLAGALCRYDEGLDYFRMLTDEDSSYLSFQRVDPHVKGSNSPQIYDGLNGFRRLPTDLGIAFCARPATSETVSFSARHTEVDFLGEFARLCRFSGATAISPIEGLHVATLSTIYSCKSLRFVFDIGKDRISHAKLSFGQRRLLSYLYYLACNTQIGIADELVNGMHHEWIEHCLDTACADRQMFYTSQNPLLLDFLVFTSEAEVSERFVTCKWNEHDGFVWENFDDRTGQEFYRLYKAGIQHVSDILRTKNWW